MIEIKEVGINLLQAQLAGLDGSQIESLILDVAASARNHWIKLAGAMLHGTRSDYIAGIQEIESQPGMAVIALVGMLPNLLEQGMPAMDMHNTLLGPNVPVVPVGERGKHAKKGGGYYRAIPFRHAGPNAGGVTGAPMGSQFTDMMDEKAAKKLGRDVYNAAKKLAPSTTDPYKKTVWGGHLPSGMAPKLKPHHATDIFSGMVKMQKTYQHATQNQYMTFRTISTGSPGWIRPETQGVHLAVKVGQFIDNLVPQVVAAYFSGQGSTP